MKRMTMLALAAGLVAPLAIAQTDNQLQVNAQKALRNDRFHNVTVSIDNNVATLTGTVDVFATKRLAEEKVQRVKGIEAVRDRIEIAEANLSDTQLQDKLVSAISHDRIGYGTTPFNSITVNVQNGVANLGGFAYGPVDADSAVAVAAYTKGVKDVVNEIDVNPVSPMDDGIRLRVFRAVYGFPSLNRYALDPAKPIRIQVQNGNVALYGVVDNEGDKDAAGIRANIVPGVFSVTNHLQVATSSKES